MVEERREEVKNAETFKSFSLTWYQEWGVLFPGNCLTGVAFEIEKESMAMPP